MKKTLLAVAVLLSSQSYAEFTNLHFYAQKDNYKMEIVQSELESGADQLKELVEISNISGKSTPMHVAIAHNNFDALKLFVEHKDYIDVKNSYEQTGLMISLKLGLKSYAQLLIDNGASLNETDVQGNSVDAYAKVGGVNLKELYKNRKTDIMSPVPEEEYTAEEDFEEELSIDNDYLERVSRMENNLNDLILLIDKHDGVINHISNNKGNVADELKAASADIKKIKQNLNKQAGVLIALVKKNKNTINIINSQIKKVNYKTDELTDKLENLNKIKKQMGVQLEAIKSVEKTLETTTKEMIKPNLEKILAEKSKLEENNPSKIIKNKDLFANVDSELGKFIPLAKINHVDPELTLADKIEEHLILILGVIVFLLLVAYIAFKFRTKKSLKNSTQEVVEEDDEDEDEDEDGEENKSMLNKTLDSIEIDENDNDVVESNELFEDQDDILESNDLFEDQDDIFSDQDDNSKK